MKTLLAFGALGAALVVSACQTPEGQGWGDLNNPDFGNAVRTNIAVQTVNPNAPDDRKPMTASGTATATALDRYDHDAVKEPIDTGMANGSGGFGGAGASSGSPGK